MGTFAERELKSAKVLLRCPVVQDAPVLFERYTHDPEVTRYLQWTPHQSVAETQDYLQMVGDNWQQGKGHRAWVIDTEKGPAGMLGFSEDQHGVVVGYVLARAFWGQGLATEALRLVSDAVMNDTTQHRVWAYCDVENLASARVMEKAGMQKEGLLRRFCMHPNLSDTPRDVLVYSRVR